ncbi:MAG: hypothetical protein AB1726_18785 [Planctomycetota bacterium]
MTKVAVGVFAGGVVFGTLLPELSITIGETVVDSFWIGSCLVVVLTGIYAVAGGLRAVACAAHKTLSAFVAWEGARPRC